MITTRGAVIYGSQNRKFQNHLKDDLPEKIFRFCKLPRRLATVLPTTYSSTSLNSTQIRLTLFVRLFSIASKYFRVKKRLRSREITQDSLLTLARIGKFSRLLRPVGPAFMFSVCRTEKFRVCSCDASTSFMAHIVSALQISECISGLSLSRPVRIIGLLGFYPNNSLIRRSPILQCLATLSEEAFQPLSPMEYYRQFPSVILLYRAG